jgi:4-diphosphocytidyl-2-C-methyl-D-erythritol kinase
MKLTAPAKLTTSLRMVGLRSDGYHLLESEMVTVSLADSLEIFEGEHGTSVHGLSVSGDAFSIAGRNLCDQALELVGRQARVEIEKHIPIGGGLGGGSADAAAILRWAHFEDLDRAAVLGSDVPFCLLGGRAFVSGIGEVVEPAPFEPRAFTLILPALSVSTVAVYQAFDEVGAQSSAAAHVNDLEAAARLVSPALSGVMDELQRQTGTAPSLAGSGSTLFYEGSKNAVGLDEHLVLEGITCKAVDVATVPPKWNEGE